MKVTVIAEIGVNHNGQEDLAIRLIDAAVDAGADIVKFQSFKADSLATRTASLAAYQEKAVAAMDQNAMLRRLELGEASYRHLRDHAEARRVGFLSSPFDVGQVAFLAESLRLSSLKIASGEITNGPLLLAAARSGRRIILSTGMSTVEEIEAALHILAFGSLQTDERPSVAGLRRAFENAGARAHLSRNVALLQCCSAYPAPPADVNLRAIEFLKERFGLEVGLSDHTTGIAVPIAAVAVGATIIEKHLTLSNSMDGPDHAMSLNPGRFTEMVAGIREVELSLGVRHKGPTPSETPNRPLVRRSLVAQTPIRAGDRFTSENLSSKRPGHGISPMEYWNYLGTVASRDYEPDDIIVP